MANIRYSIGTNPEILEQLSVQGHQVRPLSDGESGYGGTNRALRTHFDSVDLVIAHYYEFKRTLKRSNLSLADTFDRFQKTDTYVVLLAPPELRESAREELTNNGIKTGFTLIIPKEFAKEIDSLVTEKTGQPAHSI